MHGVLFFIQVVLLSRWSLACWTQVGPCTRQTRLEEGKYSREKIGTRVLPNVITASWFNLSLNVRVNVQAAVHITEEVDTQNQDYSMVTRHLHLARRMSVDRLTRKRKRAAQSDERGGEPKVDRQSKVGNGDGDATLSPPRAMVTKRTPALRWLSAILKNRIDTTGQRTYRELGSRLCVRTFPKDITIQSTYSYQYSGFDPNES
ncbi:hypothetical protein CONPUDRAFT_78365 [Coniophora puteana RWD-64-598 SS2]|uniref:Secreted protein n=1 Tax=Coniophora puteana (strain RWD-64-598) TaxID=741705 RepID=R7SCV9_CONPW|nr:uncharacterized protein CONPUDRAFT_78365 [Coniophora puteana RWD-64-598 SS2]EIW73998.1 hypothetical protein CONPUDRAFT_78365 [Coniophora puteana RWD-64-598 SS2]